MKTCSFHEQSIFEPLFEFCLVVYASAKHYLSKLTFFLNVCICVWIFGILGSYQLFYTLSINVRWLMIFFFSHLKVRNYKWCEIWLQTIFLTLLSDANGSGWWDCNMEGIDSEEVGCNEVWEGMGSTTLGGLEWHWLDYS